MRSVLRQWKPGVTVWWKKHDTLRVSGGLHPHLTETQMQALSEALVTGFARVRIDGRTLTVTVTRDEAGALAEVDVDDRIPSLRPRDVIAGLLSRRAR